MPRIATAKKPAAATTLRTITIPPLGADWPEQGGRFVGIRKLGDNDVAVIVPTDPGSDFAPAPWADAIKKAATFKTKQHQDFVAADRVDLYLAYTHAPDIFKKDWYWSSTRHADDSSSAWIQSFISGGQGNFLKVTDCRVRAVRRVIL